VPPTVLHPVRSDMRVMHEEQFGPVVPVCSFERPEEVYDWIGKSAYGQQVSIFSSGDANAVGPMLDVLANLVSRVNLNEQSRRGPDDVPFAARKDSGTGTLSIRHSLKLFTIPALCIGRVDENNKRLVNGILQNRTSRFMQAQNQL